MFFFYCHLLATLLCNTDIGGPIEMVKGGTHQDIPGILARQYGLMLKYIFSNLCILTSGQKQDRPESEFVGYVLAITCFFQVDGLP